MKPLVWGEGWKHRKLDERRSLSPHSHVVTREALRSAEVNSASASLPVTLPYLAFLDPKNAFPFERVKLVHARRESR